MDESEDLGFDSQAGMEGREWSVMWQEDLAQAPDRVNAINNILSGTFCGLM